LDAINTPSDKSYSLIKIIGMTVLGVLLLLLPLLLPTLYHRQVANQAIIYVILVVGYNFALGFTGLLSFAQVGFFAIGAYTSALLSVKAGIPFWICLPMAGVIAGTFGVIVGIPTTRIKGHYLAMVTLAFSEVVRIVLTNWKSFTGGADGIIGIPAPSLGFFTFNTKTSFYYLLVVITIPLLIAAHNIHRSRFGRMFNAIRDTELAAEVMGIHSTRIKVLAFVLSSFYAGIAGSLYAHSYNYISPEGFGVGQTVIILAMLLIGGSGRIAGAVIGAVVLTILPEYLRFVKEYYMFVFGISIFVIVLFFPQGLIGLASLFQNLKDKVLVHNKKG
jgi:branched-chain amino acid transport system permease protein